MANDVIALAENTAGNFIGFISKAVSSDINLRISGIVLHRVSASIIYCFCFSHHVKLKTIERRFHLAAILHAFGFDCNFISTQIIFRHRLIRA